MLRDESSCTATAVELIASAKPDSTATGHGIPARSRSSAKGSAQRII